MQIHNPKNLKKSEKKLALFQRRLSRKQKGSGNRNKARMKVASIQEHIANQRTDFHNKLSDAMLRAYDTVITENLNVSGMVKNHHICVYLHILSAELALPMTGPSLSVSLSGLIL